MTTAAGGFDERRRVRHARYGEGTVESVERGGLSLRVRFDQFPGLHVSLPSRLLRLVETDAAAPLAREHVAKTAAPALSVKLAEKRQVLEALRLGVVPMRGLMAYTVGRDREIETFRSMIEDPGCGRAVAVLGDYGTGKTHMLELMQHLALARNWVVGRTWLDPQEAPPSKPRRVYSALARSLVYPDRLEAGECGLLPLLEGEPVDLCDGDGCDHVFLGPALRFARALSESLDQDPGSLALAELSSRMLDWIEGRATGVSQDLQRSMHRRLHVRDRVLALSDFGTLPRVYGYMISGLGMLARKRGYAGLLLLLDETELFSALDLEARSRAVDVFRVLLSAALPQGDEIDVSEVRRGGRGIIRRLPPRFGHQSHVAIGLAATPGSLSETFLRETLGASRVLELSSFGREEFYEMGDRVFALYLDAHPGLNPAVIAGLESKMDLWLSRGFPSGPREFGRRVVDFLDQCRHASLDFSRGAS